MLTRLRGKADYWHSAQGTKVSPSTSLDRALIRTKEVYHLQLAAGTSVPRDWVKVGSTKVSTQDQCSAHVDFQAFARYTTPETLPLIRKVQEVRETRTVAFRNFFRILMAEFDTDREIWLKAVRCVFAIFQLLLLTPEGSLQSLIVCSRSPRHQMILTSQDAVLNSWKRTARLLNLKTSVIPPCVFDRTLSPTTCSSEDRHSGLFCLQVPTVPASQP